MVINVQLVDGRSNTVFDISDAVSELKITTYIKDNPGKCTFNIISPEPLEFSEGAVVTVKVDGKGVFKGYVFKITRSNTKEIISVTCYDQLRYLKNKDSYIFDGVTSSQIFKKICEDWVLKYNIKDPSTYVCTARSEENKSLYEIIQNAFTDTLYNTGEWFIIRDNFGVLEHVNVKSLMTGVMLGDESGVTGYTLESSIDSKTYNQIKLYRDDKSTGVRHTYIVNDTINGGENLKAWGILQLYKKVDENLNKSQIEAKAREMLKLYNAPVKSLKLSSVGTFDVFAGCIFQCNIEDIGINSYMLVTECTHTLSNNEHQMDLKTEVYV